MIPAFFSSLCMALMIIFDKLMVDDCYENDTRQALFISSILGGVFGLIVTAMAWLVLGLFGEMHTYTDILLSPYGLLIFIAGIITCQSIYHYFACFSEDANASVMASWIAAMPILIYLTIFALDYLGFVEAGAILSWQVFVGVIMATVGLIFLEKTVQESGGATKARYAIHLFLYVAMNVIYVIIIDQTLEQGSEHISALSSIEIGFLLLPLYWAGFLTGSLRIFRPTLRQRLGANRENIIKFLKPILLVEVLGMGVFYLEFVGLSLTDPVTVAMIIGAHAVIVWYLGIRLAKFGSKLIDEGTHETTILRVPVRAETLQSFAADSKLIRSLQLKFIGLVLAGLYIFMSSL